MTAFFRNNNVRILIITLLLVLFSLIVLAPSIAFGGMAAIEQAAIRPADTNSGSIFTSVGQFIGNFILTIASMVTWAGGKLLELSIEKFILNLGALINDSIGVSINNLWMVIRDMANLAFIFGFIYIGIMTIIDSSSANTKRMLASIIIGALLINFSLFFTKIIIDVSNYIAVEIYNSFIVTSAGGNTSISAKFADTLGITTFYEFKNADQYAKTTTMGNIAFYFMAAIMLIVAGFVFAAGAILILIRFVALVFIMIFSPLLFAATVFPQTESMASDLWKKLINYSFFAPAYLILLMISLKVLESVVAVFKSGSLVNALNGGGGGATPPADFFDVILNFVIAILFLIMSLQIAMKFGVAGANKVMSVGNSVRGKVQSAVGRNTVGAASGWALKKYEKANASAQNSKTGRNVSRVLKYGSLGMLGDRNVRGALESGKKAKFGGDYSRADDKAYDEEHKKRQATHNEKGKLNDIIKAGTEAGAGPAAKMAMEKAVAGASVKFLEELDQKEREKIVDFMTSSQFEGLQKSAELSDTDKSELSRARAGAVRGRVTAAGGIHKASGKDLDALDFDTDVVANAGILSSKQIDDMTLTQSAKAHLKKARQDALTAEYDGGTGAATLFGRITNDAERAKLSPDILTDSNAAQYFTINTLTKILDNDDLTEAHRATIKANVETVHLMNPAMAARFNDFFDSPLGRRYG